MYKIYTADIHMPGYMPETTANFASLDDAREWLLYEYDRDCEAYDEEVMEGRAVERDHDVDREVIENLTENDWHVVGNMVYEITTYETTYATVWERDLVLNHLNGGVSEILTITVSLGHDQFVNGPANFIGYVLKDYADSVENGKDPEDVSSYDINGRRVAEGKIG